MSAPRPVRLRTVALPIEHGAWGFFLEPAVLGLLVAASWAGVALVLAALAALLLQTPLSIVVSDARRGRRYPRTALAWRFVAAYGAALVAFGAWAIAAHGGPGLLLPAALAVPLVAVQLAYEARNRPREAVPETSGALAMGSLAACVAVAGGWPLLPALGLWALLAARTIPAILYVRARLRLERGERVDVRPSTATHGVALAGVAAAAAAGAVWWITPAPYAVLLVRAVRGLAPFRTPTTASIVGFREIAFGLLTVAGVALGVTWGA